MDKQQIILNASLKLFVAHGIQGTATSKIAKEAGVAHGSVFTYFKTKDELIIALYNYTKKHFRAYLAEHVKPVQNIKERFFELYYHSVQWSLKYQDEYMFTQQFQYSPLYNLPEVGEPSKQLSPLVNLYNEGLQAGELKTVPVDMIRALFMSQMSGTYNYIIQAGIPAKKQKEIISDTFEMLWTMLAR
ncbi:TetR/AcrR family transcriptional regulator [Mucilaginibacter aquaedulcis]|uniref:TetR/AcrR family transcriptional regulator n=1 Tax=Mucilaginibacter aquaedulcis TaxID=1187081 RepID=UPI0025B531CD|nr:TetR/AcrR family transcriptional regulator [Mucilaginibacter aquaedulcis]MDN3550463.1 TetR/AcrR family transcriptional regulator [Mucilaginibacter aquaedulcis]